MILKSNCKYLLIWESFNSQSTQGIEIIMLSLDCERERRSVQLVAQREIISNSQFHSQTVSYLSYSGEKKNAKVERRNEHH